MNVSHPHHLKNALVLGHVMRSVLFSGAFLMLTLIQCMKVQAGIPVHFTETTELISTIMHLSMADEYTWGEMSDYQDDVESFFSDVKNHKAVKMVKKLRRSGFGYDKPMAFALRLKVDNGHVVSKEGILDDEKEYLGRWDSRNEEKLIRQVDDFYRRSHFHEFYTLHQDLYARAESAMKAFSDTIDEAWYDRFFGPQESASFEVVPSFLNGPANYAATIHWDNGTDTYYAIMGCCAPDGEGHPEYHMEEVFPVIIHERNHAYCNPLNSEFWDGMKDKANALFLPERDFFTQAAYGTPELMMNETFVEASVIYYLQEHGMYIADLYLEYDLLKRHYYLIPSMLEAFKKRELRRDLYPTMHDFMPQLIEAINTADIQKPDIEKQPDN